MCGLVGIVGSGQVDVAPDIYDALTVNPQSVMPPFGRHKLLTEEEIDNIVEFLQSI